MGEGLKIMIWIATHFCIQDRNIVVLSWTGKEIRINNVYIDSTCFKRTMNTTSLLNLV